MPQSNHCHRPCHLYYWTLICQARRRHYSILIHNWKKYEFENFKKKKNTNSAIHTFAAVLPSIHVIVGTSMIHTKNLHLGIADGFQMSVAIAELTAPWNFSQYAERAVYSPFSFAVHTMWSGWSDVGATLKSCSRLKSLTNSKVRPWSKSQIHLSFV